MRAAVWFVALLCGCSFQPGQLRTANQDADVDPVDGDMRDGSVADARSLDAMPDAPPAATTDHGSTADTFLASDFATTNFSNSNSSTTNLTSALVDGGDTPRVIVMRFDVSSIPANAVVTGVNLHIWTDFDSGADVTIYPLLQAWDETAATWNERMTGVAWTTAGAAPPSRGTTAVGTVNPTAANTGYVVPVTAATVQGWVASPATNHGLVFVTTNMDGTRFSTRENGTVANRPFLRVTHAP